jgi:hypothetical protein
MLARPSRPSESVYLHAHFSCLTTPKRQHKARRMLNRAGPANPELNEGEVFVAARGVQHCPVAKNEAHILLIEPAGTPNTGDPATTAPRIVNDSGTNRDLGRGSRLDAYAPPADLGG